MATKTSKKAGNGHGLTVSIEYDDITDDVLNVLVENRSSDDVFVAIGAGGSKISTTVGAGVIRRASLAALGAKVTEKENVLMATDIPISTRWPA